MKALTLYQPYALLIVAGAKRIETRLRKTNIRGTIAVHAAKKPAQMVLNAITSPVLRQKLVEVIGNIHPASKACLRGCYRHGGRGGLYTRGKGARLVIRKRKLDGRLFAGAVCVDSEKSGTLPPPYSSDRKTRVVELGE